MPYVFVASDAFALNENIMEPYSVRKMNNEQRMFNYKLLRTRRTVENALGILSQRFRIFTRPIQLNPDKVELITMTACCLHNFLLRDSTSASVYMPAISDSPADSLPNIARQGSTRSSEHAVTLRNRVTHYFNSLHGAVAWQESVA